MVMHVFSPAPVRCNDNKSDTVLNQSTPDHNDIAVMTTFIVVKEVVLVLRMWRNS